VAQSVFLPLAEKMAQKYVEDKKIEAEAGKIMPWFSQSIRHIDLSVCHKNISLYRTTDVSHHP
jgi:hypothetical protein